MQRATLPLLLLAAMAAASQSVEAQSPGSVSVGSEAVEISIGGRVQTQFNTTTVLTEAPSEMILRRARIEIDVKVNDVVSGSVNPEFAAGDVALRGAFIKLSLHPAFEVVAGQDYKPFGLIEQTSSTRILPIERGARIRGMDAMDEYGIINDLEYSDRDVGLQIMGEPGFIPLGFAYEAGIFRGPLHGASAIEDSYQYAARVTVEPLDVVRIGGGWSSRHFLALPLDEANPFTRGHAFEVDLEVGTFAPGLHLLGEIAWGDADPDSGEDFFGTQGWLAWRSERLSRVFSAVEPIFRASYGERGDVNTTLLTPGLNVYFGGRNRFMLNYDFALLEDALDPDIGNEGSFKAQFQLAF